MANISCAALRDSSPWGAVLTFMPMESTMDTTGMEKQSQNAAKRAAFLQPYTVRRPSSLAA